jgi:GT2 family glycosyltransferase
MMKVSIMITTKNRSPDLNKTLGVLKGLDPQPLEVLITADGCSDDTVDMVKRELPDARLVINEQGRGSVASRDRMIREARGDLILAIDDDSYPEQKDALADVSRFFEENPKLAVMGLPQRTDEYPESLTQTDFGAPRRIRSFTSSGAVLRKSIYLTLPGFAHEFFHMYEEPDYTLQCIAAGYEVIFMPQAPSIRHHWTGSGRSEMRNHQRHGRNEFWSTVMRCPMPYLIPVAAYRIYRQFGYACSRGMDWVIHEPQWWWAAIKGLPQVIKGRNPVSWTGYRKWLSLK